ncbi:MAG: serine/threonine-protein kinase [Roseibacillus sp.]|jgi:serine/threonine-protein kinase
MSPLSPAVSAHPRRLRTRSRLGKYRIEALLAEGYYSNVYRAFDTIEGLRVALKIPHPHLADDSFLEGFRHEARLTAKIESPRLLSLKDASVIDGHFVLAYPLGIESLADRLTRRLSTQNLAVIIEHCLEGLAVLHQQRILHCDIKPENFILFPGPSVRLADFGIARIANRTLNASGSGTLGYMAPEQAMGKPSFRSDVFAMGLLLYRMLTKHLPEYPFAWPPPENAKLRRKVHPEFIALIRKALEVSPRRRFRDADAFNRAFRQIRRRALY